ncbi:MAG: hypothetical protein H6716_08595 [Polyangiaceae bacterium]|nr:hypothetical protein [Polyangiaceae bacterium]
MTQRDKLTLMTLDRIEHELREQNQAWEQAIAALAEFKDATLVLDEETFEELTAPPPAPKLAAFAARC